MSGSDPVTGEPDVTRFVLDETSLEFTGLSSGTLTDGLTSLCDTIEAIRRDGFAVYQVPGGELYEYSSLPGTSFFEVLFGDALDRDTRLRLQVLLQKCPDWDADVLRHDEVAVDHGAATGAFSLAYVLACALAGRAVARVLFDLGGVEGLCRLSSGADIAEIWCAARPEHVPLFWRHVITADDAPVGSFLAVSAVAFPELIFLEDLDVGCFKGSYRDTRHRLVTGLSALNDHFLQVHRDSRGEASQVQQRMATLGADVSRESSNTHKNAAAMREREVTYSGETYLCEWHLKLERHRNRVHFSFGVPLGDRILIGIFDPHLST